MKSDMGLIANEAENLGVPPSVLYDALLSELVPLWNEYEDQVVTLITTLSTQLGGGVPLVVAVLATAYLRDHFLAQAAAAMAYQGEKPN